MSLLAIPMWALQGLGGAIVGKALFADSWQETAAFGFFATPWGSRCLAGIGKYALHAGWWAARMLVQAISRSITWLGVRVATSGIAGIGGAILLGVGIGMILGHYTVGQIWGASGQKKVVKFYSGQGHYWDTDPGGSGYFNMKKNFDRVWDHYAPHDYT